jgi:hypothetical protein
MPLCAFLHPHHLNSRLPQKFQCCAVGIALPVDDFSHPGVDHHLGAEYAGLVSAVKGGSLDADAVQRRLNDGVLLGVHRPAQLVVRAALHVLACAADEVAVVQAGGSAVVAACSSQKAPLALL